MKGILLAGGTGSRLHPLTVATSKQLLPVYDKPMIYYPLSTIMLAGIREILVICTPTDEPAFRRLLGDGGQWGLEIDYATQDNPNGIAEAFLIGERFLAGSGCTLILGDNLFYGGGLARLLQTSVTDAAGATVFAQEVSDPQRYGVVTFDHAGLPVSIEEKPNRPVSNWALTGLYVFDKQVVDVARQIRPSGRGELEITDVNRVYLEEGELTVRRFGRGFAWLDTGTFDSLVAASEFVRVLEQRQGVKIGCVEEVAWRMGWISDEELSALADPLLASGYGAYLERLVRNGRPRFADQPL